MTPLAHRILKELTLPKRSRTFQDHAQVLPRMSGIHCFEVSEIIRPAIEMVKPSRIGDEGDEAAQVYDRVRGMANVTGFLPAPKTWIEYAAEGGGRTGLLLEEGETRINCSLIVLDDKRGIFQASPYRFEFGKSENFSSEYWLEINQNFSSKHDEMIGGYVSVIYSLLAFINTPRVIGRRQHMPHRGLEKRLVAALKPVGRFPLHAWTEILLHVTPPKDASAEPSVEAHLTGERALHFCRAHLRIRLGRLEIVRAHWRGDGSLGIKQSRYKVAA